MKVDDDVRLKVLSALFQSDAIEPNYSHIAEISGLDIKTVRNSLFFLEKEGIIDNYSPMLDVKKLGFNHNHVIVTQFEFDNESQEKEMRDKIMKEIPNMYLVSECDGPGLMNTFHVGIYRTHKERHDLVTKASQKLRLRRFIKQKMSIPLFERYHMNSPSKTIIKILMKERGL